MNEARITYKLAAITGLLSRYPRDFSLKAFMFAVLSLAGTAAWSQPYTVASPDGNLNVDVTVNPFQYEVKLGANTVLEKANLGITLSNHAFTGSVNYVSHEIREIDESYTMPHGTKSLHVNHCNEMKLVVSNGSNQLEVFVRAYDNGMAYRYTIPGAGNDRVNGESSAYRFPNGSVLWSMNGYLESYESEYGEYRSGHQNGDKSFPMLARTPDGVFVLISEAAVFGTYSGAKLSASNNYTMTIKLIDAPSARLPWETPWRAAVIGDLATIVEDGSELFRNLNPPSVIEDQSWIVPGVASWSWMRENVTDAAQQIRYIDFASEMGFKYCLVDEGWPRFNVQPLFDHAATKNVKLILWIRSNDMASDAAMASQMDAAVNYGAAGLKVDYFTEANTQQKMQLLDKLLIESARRKLMINFHGVNIPHGEQRTYPHMMSKEAVRGNEWFRNSGVDGVKARSNTIEVFVRGCIGPMDVTPGTIGPRYQHQTTNAHELARFITSESGWQHPSDSPEDYKGQSVDVLDFFKALPTAWDETRFIEGLPGTHFVVARRTGSDWWIAGINAETARDVEIDLSFMQPGIYSGLNMWSDASANSAAHKKEKIDLDASGTLSVRMERRGGFVVGIPNSITGSIKPIASSNARSRVRISRSGSQYLIHNTLDSDYRLQVLDCLGRVKISGYGTRGETYRVESGLLAPGVYIIRVDDVNGNHQTVEGLLHE